MENTKTCYLTTHRKMIVIGGGIFIVGILLGAFVGHRGERFDGGRGRFPMQANQNFRGQMMRGQNRNYPQQQAVSGQVLPVQPQVGNQQQAPVQAPPQATK